MPRVQDISQFDFRCWIGMPRPMPRAHLHSEIEINWIDAGSITYLFNGATVSVPARRLAVFWAAFPHQLLAIDGLGCMAWITVPVAWLVQWGLPRGLVDAVLSGGLVIETAEDALDEGRFRQWAIDWRRDQPWRGIAAREVEARLHRCAASTPLPAAVRRPRRGAALGAPIERAVRFLAEHYTEDVSVATVARQAGLHPHWLMETFRRQCGLSVHAYLLRLRLAHAQRLLATTDRDILAIALDAGFGSLGRFYVNFRRACGVAPGVYRKRLRQA